MVQALNNTNGGGWRKLRDNHGYIYESESNGKLTTTHIYYESEGKPVDTLLNLLILEAVYQGRKVKLDKPVGDVKKFKVYEESKGIVKVNFDIGILQR